MNKYDLKRQALIDAAAAHLLRKGLANSGLRALAGAANTSDRMLVYYFGSKEALINQSLGLISDGLTGQLDQLLAEAEYTADSLFQALMAQGTNPVFLPTLRVWFELVGLAVRGEQPYAGKAREIAGRWIQWIEQKLSAAERHLAADLFARLEGHLVLALLGTSGGQGPQAAMKKI